MLSHPVASDSLQPHGLYSQPGFSDQGIFQPRILEWAGCHFLLPGIFPSSLDSPVLAGGFFTTEPPGNPGSDSKESACNAGDRGDMGSIPGLRRSPRAGNSNPLQYSCLEKSHGQRSLAGYSPQGCKESDMTK